MTEICESCSMRIYGGNDHNHWYCCSKFNDWVHGYDEYIWFDTSINKYRGDGYNGGNYIFDYCPFCGSKLQ